MIARRGGSGRRGGRGGGEGLHHFFEGLQACFPSGRRGRQMRVPSAQTRPSPRPAARQARTMAAGPTPQPEGQARPAVFWICVHPGESARQRPGQSRLGAALKVNSLAG